MPVRGNLRRRLDSPALSRPGFFLFNYLKEIKMAKKKAKKGGKKKKKKKASSKEEEVIKNSW